MDLSPLQLVLRAGAIAIYLAGALAVLGVIHAPLARPAEVISAVLLGLHALETVAMFKHVKRYQGPVALSVLLSVLFGLLHWLPLAKAARAARDA